MSDRSARRTRNISIISLFVALSVLGLKLFAWQLTGSIALYSDALESVVNVVTAIAALVAVSLAARPADAALPYGYHKAEYFSAVLVGVMIIVAAILIAREALFGLLDPQMPTAPTEGLAISAGATIINAVWAVALIRHGRKVMSPALSADGKHLMTDVVSTVAVLTGLGIVYATGWAAADAVLAGFVALNILWSGWGVVRESVGGLMDVAVPADRQRDIREIISTSASGAIEAHDIRTRQAGRMMFIDFHLVVPGAMIFGCACDLRPHRGAIARSGGRLPDHHSCRTRDEGQAFRDRRRLTTARERCKIVDMMRFLGLLLILLVVPCAGAGAAPYENARFGYQLTIPIGFAGQGESQNGDGQVFRANDGAELRVWGGWLSDGFEDEVGERMERLEADGWGLSYHAVTPGWASFSGMQGGTIIYQRMITLCDRQSYAAFALRHGVRVVAEMREVVERLAASLRATGC